MLATRHALLALSLVFSLSTFAHADWPSLFSSKKETSKDTMDGFWKSERPSFGSAAPSRSRPTPAAPTVWSRMGSSSKKFYNGTAGRVGMPKIKSPPVSVTGRHTPWTRTKPKEESGGMFSWMSSKPSGPARSTDEFFQLKRPD